MRRYKLKPKPYIGWSFSDQPGVSYHIGTLPGFVRPAVYVIKDSCVEVLAWVLPKPHVLDELFRAVSPFLAGTKPGVDAPGVED